MDVRERAAAQALTVVRTSSGVESAPRRSV